MQIGCCANLQASDQLDGGSGTSSNYGPEPTDLINGGRVGFFDALAGRLSIYCSEKVVLRADVVNGQLQNLVTGQRATIRVEVRRQQDADHVSVAFNGAAIGE